MPAIPSLGRLATKPGLRVVIGALVAGFLVSCAVKKSSPDKPVPAESGKPRPGGPSPTASPSPQPSATPTPAPTPEVRYTATVRVEGGPTTEADVTPDAKPSPSPSGSPAANPSPTATPAATPAPKKSGNFFPNLWTKIFPPKAKPSPSPATAASAAPTPIQLPSRPKEGFISRMWHRVFPKKQEPPVAAPPQWIGTIKLVNERDGYVLIDAVNAPSMAPGETLNAVGNDLESGVLRTTADRNPPFFIADLVSGKPRVGDRVYSPTP